MANNRALGIADNGEIGDLLAKGEIIEDGVPTGTTADQQTAWVTRAQLAADPAFSSRYARGARLAIIGDSIARGNGTWNGITTDLETRVGPLDWLAQAIRGTSVQGRAHQVINAGIGGTGTAPMLARFDSDITPYAPNVVVIGGGTNDTGVGTTLATFAANIRALVAKSRSIGAVPVLVLAPPNDVTTGGRLTDIITFNMWLRNYAATERLPLIDYHSVLVDPADGTFLSSMTDDGTHPNAAGVEAMAAAAGPVLAQVLAPWSPPIATHNTDTLNLVTNGLYLTDSNADGLPDNHVKLGLTCTLTSDAFCLGNWLNIASVSTGEEFVTTWQITTGWSVGDRIAVSFRFANVPGTSVGNIYAGVNFNGAASTRDAFHLISDFNRSVPKSANWLCYGEAVIPTGTTSLAFVHSRMMTTVGSGASSSIAQATIRNLTTNAILTT